MLLLRTIIFTLIQNQLAFKERLKFYADTYREKNKLYCFTISSVLDLKAALWRFFDKGWNIRAAWYEKIDTETGEVRENQKLQLSKLLEEYLDDRRKRK